MQRVLVVCTANVCRSPMAESIARFVAQSRGLAPRIEVASAGTEVPWPGSLPDARAAAALARHGYPRAPPRARRVTADDFARHDLVLAMDRRNLALLRDAAPREHQAKLSLFLDLSPALRGQDVPDPYYTNSEGFERVLSLCESGVESLLASLSMG